MQINLQKSKAATAELNMWEYDIALVQEPNLTPGGALNLVQHPRKGYCLGGARAAIVVNETIEYWPIDSLSTKDMAVIAVKTGGQQSTLYMASCYLDSLQAIPSRELIRLTDHCNEQRIPLLIGTDANAHSRAWGEDVSNHRGEALEDWIMQNDMYVINVGRTPTHVPDNGNRSTIIDLTLANGPARYLINDWGVLVEEPSLSDHRLIRYRIDTITSKESSVVRSLAKVNWEKYKNHLEKHDIKYILQEEDLDMRALILQEDLVEALNVFAPKKARSHKHNKTWWSELLKQKRKILRNVQRKKNTHTRVADKYRQLKKEYSHELARAKKQSWKDFCSKAESARDISKIIQILENPPKRQMSLLSKEEVILAPQDSLNHLVLTHFPDSALGDGDTQEGVSHHENNDTADFSGICQYINTTKIKAAFKSFGDYKSPGPYELPPIALKHMSDKHLDMVCLIYRQSLATGKVPKCWRIMKVVFIPKAGKSDYAVAKAYRPITLSNFLLKGLERLIQWFILEYHIREPLFRQHAYTKGYSCETALSTFVNDVERAIYNGRYVLAVSLDCSGAFDCIKFDAAQTCMERKNIPKNIITWYVNLLRNRTVTAEVQGFSATICPARGSPQGGVLSPLIWNLIMDSFLTQFQGDSVRVLGYADDILLYIEGTDPILMGNLLQPALDKVIEWGDINGLSFNPTKTKTILFTKRRRMIKLPSLHLDGADLKYDDSFKYLGVEIHKSLSWTRHITERANKCKFLLMKSKNVISTKWGLTPDKMEWVYKAMVRPKLTYGAITWAHDIKELDKLKIQRVQRLALLSILRPLRSTPTAGMEAILGWMPLTMHCEEIGLCAYLRTKEMPRNTWDGIGKMTRASGHIAKWQKLENKFISCDLPRQSKFSKYIWREETPLTWAKDSFETPLVLYTDASKEGENIGYAWCACDGDYVIAEDRLSTKGVSVHHAEIMAIKEALSWLKDHGDPNRNTVLFSDSQSAVMKLNGHTAEDELVLTTMELTRDITKTISISINWVKGHSNQTGNEFADALARMGAKEATMIQSVYPFYPLTHKEIKKLIHVNFIEQWKSWWSHLDPSKYHITRLFIPQISETQIVSRMNQKDLRKLVQIITGHGLFKRHLRHWNDIQDIACQLCGEENEDPWHLWNLCPALNGPRTKIKQEIDRGLLWQKGLVKFFQGKELTHLYVYNETLLKPS